jgi:hypothetical protein
MKVASGKTGTVQGTSKNRRYSSDGTKLPANDSATFTPALHAIGILI